MGKVAQVLITGYWPDRVPRRIGVPQKPLGEQFLSAASKAAGAAAIVSAHGVVSHEALLAQVQRLAAGISGLTAVRDTVAFAGTDRAGILAGFLAAQLAGCRAALLDSRDQISLERSVRALDPELLVLADTAFRKPDGTRQAVSLDDLALNEGQGQRRGRWRDVAAILPVEAGFAGHGHVSTTAMVKALTTYIPLLEAADFICTGPLWRWDGFSGAMTAILSGRAVVLDPLASGWTPAQSYGFLSRDEADAIVRTGNTPEWTRSVRLLFVVMSEFDVRWRRKLESVLRRAILPLWGTQRTGPAICAHPSWAPIDVHGMPLTNAMLVPLDPSSGAPSDVPWEMLDRAELGIEAPSVQIKDPSSEGIVFDWNGNQVARTGRIVAVDRLGMVRFLDAG